MKKIICLIIFIVVFIISVKTVVSAHEEMLDVEYDDCIPIFSGEGVDEMWYYLSEELLCYHISDEVQTIKYYFMEHAENDSNYTWTTDVSEEVAQEIKEAYASSMEKWNNVYFYSHDSNGYLVKCKIINIVEGTENDHNLSIYPMSDSEYVAITWQPLTDYLDENDYAIHYHTSNLKMGVNVSRFYSETGDDCKAEIFRELTGAHELGHILGLKDIDLCCSSNSDEYHHEEVLMGYGDVLHRSRDITYKDIAGVAITRGFHTDDDHMWLKVVESSTIQSSKYICSICNGTKVMSSQIDFFATYGYCDNNHTLSSGNMMAVASYGTKDYYKCKYCRYVAPFEDIVEQNYSYVMNDNTHTITNNVNGLQYTISGEHDGLDCSVCGYHKHMYNARHVANNSINHNSYCRCGEYVVKVHAVKNQTGLLKAPCVDCGYLLNLGGDIGQIQSVLKVSANGSKMLSTGILILVNEDIEAYLNGTLVFYNYGDNVSSS